MTPLLIILIPLVALFAILLILGIINRKDKKRAATSVIGYEGYTIEKYLEGYFIKNPDGQYLALANNRKYYSWKEDRRSPFVRIGSTPDWCIQELNAAIRQLAIDNQTEPMEVIKL